VPTGEVPEKEYKLQGKSRKDHKKGEENHHDSRGCEYWEECLVHSGSTKSFKIWKKSDRPVKGLVLDELTVDGATRHRKTVGKGKPWESRFKHKRRNG